MLVDAHHHFWRYNPAEYGWIDDAMAKIRRDFLPADLASEIAAAGIEGVVSVQARQSLIETEWLLERAQENAFIKGVVGWVDLAASQVGAQLERFTAGGKLKAVRHVVQAEPDDFLARPDFNRGIAELRRFGVAYDLLIVERQLPQAAAFVDAHPEQRFVLDHLAKPRIRDGVLEPWRRNLRELARRPNVYAKVSGLVTEADYHSWSEPQLQPYFDAALEAFGPRRLMFGSDWPVCLVACPYVRWASVARASIGHLSRDEQAWIMGNTATEAYKL